MASRKTGVRIAGLQDVDSFGSGDAERRAPDGGRLIAFRLTAWECDDEPCVPWSKARLKVAVGSDVRKLPAGKGTYVVAVPAGARKVDLVMNQDPHTQTLSLLDGEPGKDNIKVLALAPKDRRVRINESFPILETRNPDGQQLTRATTVKSAELSFFESGETPSSPRQAYLKVLAEYTIPGSSTVFAYQVWEIAFTVKGKAVKKEDFDTSNDVNIAFTVPADLRSGVLNVGGTTTSLGQGFTLTLDSRTVPISFE
jgi:hypothetical protein